MLLIRIGIIFRQASWTGGANYYRNLFLAHNSLYDNKIKLIIFAGHSVNLDNLEGLVEIFRSSIFDRKSFLWCISKFLEKVFPKRDFLLYCLLRKHRINMLSHQGMLWAGCSIRTMGWIPDFQQIRLPHFFKDDERKAQNKYFKDMIDRSNAVLLSSQDALSDMNFFSTKPNQQKYILRFACHIELKEYDQISCDYIKDKYEIDRPWFHISNQFWAHKNHTVVIKALLDLKLQGHNPLVIASGNTEDPRDPLYFNGLIRLIKDSNLQDNFFAVGLVPYCDVVALMRYSIALINPSLFEGWNTAVEEAKSIGKKIILSDIPVHREQNPERGFYFDTHDYRNLSHIMKMLMNESDEKSELRIMDRAQLLSRHNRSVFAKKFEEICLQVISDPR